MTRFLLLLSLLVGSNAWAGPLIVDTTDTVVNVVSGTYEGGRISGNGTLNFGGTARVEREPQSPFYFDNDTMNVFGGFIETMDCEGGTLNVSGGFVRAISIQGCDLINIFGGDVALITSGVPQDGIFIFGYDFEFTVFDGTEEKIMFRQGEFRPEEGDVLLTGFFADGGAIDLLFPSDDGNEDAWNGTTLVDVGDPNDVPEPGTLALLTLGLGGIGFARRRKLS